MIPYTLYIINILLFFRLILQVDFKRNKWAIACGILLIIAIFVCTNYEFERAYIIYYATSLLLIFVPVIFFQGRVLNNILYSLFFRQFVALLQSLILGLCLAVCGAKGFETHIYDYYGVLVLLIIGIVASFLVKKELNIKKVLEKVNVAILIPFIISFLILRYNIYSAGDLDEDAITMVYGFNLIKSGIIGIALVCICAMLVIVIWQRRKLEREILSKEICINEQVNQYKLLKERDEAIRKFKHDYNNHLNIIQQLTSDSEYEKLDEYVKSLGSLNSAMHYISTNNLIFDAIINQYYSKCTEEHIEMNIVGRFPDHFDISETDLCVLMSNGMENSYEAASKCVQDRHIYVEIKNYKDMIFITIENSCMEDLKMKNGVPITTKSDASKHGFGTQNMIEVVKKNKGEITWTSFPEGVVRTNICLKSS